MSFLDRTISPGRWDAKGWSLHGTPLSVGRPAAKADSQKKGRDPTRPRFDHSSIYRQQRKGERSLRVVLKAPAQALPLSLAADGDGIVPAYTGQSPPQVKQTLQAVAVCGFVTAGRSCGVGFPPNGSSCTPPAATAGCPPCAFAGPAFSITTAANPSANHPILLYIRSSSFDFPDSVIPLAHDV